MDVVACNLIAITYINYIFLYLFMENKRAKFLQMYSNVPDGLRKDIIIVVDGKTYTWDTSYFEIKEDTKLGKEILKALEEIGLL